MVRPWSHPVPVIRIRGRELQRLRAQLFLRQPFCAICLVQPSTIRDHIVPLAEGGLDIDSNTQGLCNDCSETKTCEESARGVQRWINEQHEPTDADDDPPLEPRARGPVSKRPMAKAKLIPR